ncbi:MAG: serine hydrolase domain-containing protein [Nitrososphaeraceae archaeon]
MAKLCNPNHVNIYSPFRIFIMLMNRNKMTVLTPFFVAIIFAMIGISVSTLLPTFAFSFTSPPDTNANSSVTYKEISAQVKSFIFDQIVNKSNAAIVIGFVDPDGTKIFSFGNMSTAHNIPVNQNTFFNIGSITKTFTTLLLADMVKQGIVNLNDPVEKFLPPSVKVPQFNGKKITLEDLADHTSGLPEWPSNVWLNNTVGDINPNYNVTQLYQALSDTKLTREPGAQVQYSSFGIGLLGHILSLESDGISYEELVKDRILDVLGMNDTKIALSQNETNNRFSVGHLGGKEIITPRIPTILADSGAFRSTAPDMLKYVSANLGLIHTKLDDAMQLGHLIRHSSIIANPMNYSEYRGLGWRVLTNFGTETITHTGAINGWNAFAGFIPTKQVGVIAMCSCDSTDADMCNLGFVLLHLTGVENINAKSEPRTHTTPGS